MHAKRIRYHVCNQFSSHRMIILIIKLHRALLNVSFATFRIDFNNFFFLISIIGRVNNVETSISRVCT